MLTLNEISIRVAGRLLLDEASVRIPSGARVGLVGRNGIGKTTLFRAITGELPVEHGSIDLPARARIGRLAQEAPGGPESLLDDALDWIMHLDGGKLTLYRGGYTAFARQRAERQALDAKFAKKQEAERKKLQAFIDRFKAKATKARQA